MFKALTMIDVKISSVPFTTIEPNIGVGHVIVDCVDREFNTRCQPKHGMCKDGKRFVPVKLMDVAGIVPDAHLGKGMGNQFLDDLREADALIHIVDASGDTDMEGKPVAGLGDPVKDVEFLEREIDLWYANLITRSLKKFERDLAKLGKADLPQAIADQLAGLNVKKADIEHVLDKMDIETFDLKDQAKIEEFASALRKISKPIIIAANKVDLGKAQDNYERLKEKFPDSLIVPTSAEAEIALKRAAEKGLIGYLPGGSFTTAEGVEAQQGKALEFMKQRIIGKYGSTGVQQCLNRAVFELLGNITVYPVADRSKLSDTAGHVLPDAMILPRGTTVRQMAFRIHTDIGNKFICGIDVRSKRKLAADYELKDKDVIEIMTAK
jgi:ribosome-binding ATPase